MTDPLIGTLIGDRYRLIDVAGRGGMGIVYRAEDTRLAGRPCAVKLLLGGSLDPEESLRFERELNIISRLRSRHVVQVLDTGRHDGRRFIVMELLEGHMLLTLIRRGGPMTPARALPLTRGILAGLTEAHEVGVIHRDLKPANIFVSRTRAGEEIARILDFGIAKETRTEDTALTGKSMLIGTPKYMAPEQFKKRPADERTDLYAVGLVLYEMLAGHPPFHGEVVVPPSIASMPAEFRIGWLHVNRPPERLRVSDRLWEIIARLLSKDPDDRYPDAAAVLDALSRFGDRTGPAPLITGGLSPPTGEPSTDTGFPILGESLDLRAHSSRRYGLWAVAAACAAIGAAAALWLIRDTPVEPVVAVDATCTHRIVTEPVGATLRVGGVDVGTTPSTVPRACRQTLDVRIELAGYVTAERALAPGVGDVVRVELEPRPASEVARLEWLDAGPPDAAPDAAPDRVIPDAAPPPPRPRRVRPPVGARRPARPAPRPEGNRPEARPEANQPAAPPVAPRPAQTPPARAKPDAGSPLFF